MGLGHLRGALVSVICSLLGAGVFYCVWMAAFLLTTGLGSPLLEAVLWLLAPVVTAAGFATGITLLERLTRTGRTKFLHIFIWPLTGCAVGAGVVYWFGPMLIVFGMFAAGTASVVLREIVNFPGSN